LLPQTGLVEAKAIAERIREHVSMTRFPHGETQPLGRVTISVGVSTFSKNIDTYDKIIAAADRALYQSKSMGKNRVQFYEEPES
jgi:diguanylate cyclase (GGDEF)-like protein